MTKPPERIIYVASGYNPPLEHFQRAFILEEKKPMTQKTENLTTEEALTFINAMRALMDGKCIKNDDLVYKVNDNGELIYYCNGKWNQSIHTEWISDKLFFIVPDPSKPKEVEGEYERDWEDMTDVHNLHPDIRDNLKFILNKYYQRKP